ncbi:uncharacterized protein BX664DRAFT_331419 [Halteromyces radiatus]|uniref:uncharacterized protein n=1 Tax=Halteromyces radiatus TaxID=101107 RepID=UPI00222113DA|nr:uncharacterized protein BX664DRAFT_331419 [Halteromyces radiatus]KAI8088808.1 hypothetical protein BX664DRAFT_331419 [Halteromyces radiatus]
MVEASTIKSSGGGNTISGSVMILPTGGTAVLTGDYGGLLGATPLTTSILPTSSNILQTPTSTIPLSISLSTTSPTTLSTTNNTTSSLTNAQIGGIIGGAAGGLLLLLCLIGCIMYHRRNKPKSFPRGRGITPSMVLEGTEFQKQTSMGYVDRPFDQQSTYSFNSPHNAFGSTSSPHLVDKQQPHFSPTSPSENTTATLDKLYCIKKYNTPDTEKQNDNRTQSQLSVNGARLSKYNYLTQAFSQMRSSYATQDQQEQHSNNNPQTQADLPYIQYPDPVANTDSNTLRPSPSSDSKYLLHQSSSTTSPEISQNTRQSTATVLHAPLFQRNKSAPSPTPTTQSTSSSPSSMDAPSITLYNEHNEGKVLHQGHVLHNTIPSSTSAQSTAKVSKKLYFPGTNNTGTNRDSTVSDVSQYSTFSTASSSNPFRYSDDPSQTSPYTITTTSVDQQDHRFTSTTINTNSHGRANNNNNGNYHPSPLSEKPYAYI